MQKNLTII